MKKPIFAFLVLVRALLKLFKLELSTAWWSEEFHLSMTLSAKSSSSDPVGNATMASAVPIITDFKQLTLENVLTATIVLTSTLMVIEVTSVT